MALFGAVGEAARQGKEVLCKTAALAANGTLVVATPFATIDSVNINVKKATAPTTSVCTWNFTGGVLTVYGWKATNSSTTTLIASDAQETVSVTVIGRRRQ